MLQRTPVTPLMEFAITVSESDEHVLLYVHLRTSGQDGPPSYLNSSLTFTADRTIRASEAVWITCQ